MHLFVQETNTLRNEYTAFLVALIPFFYCIALLFVTLIMAKSRDLKSKIMLWMSVCIGMLLFQTQQWLVNAQEPILSYAAIVCASIIGVGVIRRDHSLHSGKGNKPAL